MLNGSTFYCLLNHSHLWIITLSWLKSLCNSMKLWPCHAGLPKIDGPYWRVLTKCSPLEELMANHFSILTMKSPWTVWKGKKIRQCKMSSPGQKVSNMLLGKSGGQIWIVPEIMKQLGQNGNDIQLWICLVVKVKSDAVKNNIAQEPGMWGPWIKVNWK